ncbi:MAG: energy-coupling factor transporter ATPase [Erysipelotrichales bacterium]|nr:energy-coupling factor transporter ATPase [Erysipelotrichales bacterium]
MSAVIGKHISFQYDFHINKKPILNDISFEIKKGEFIVILGANGSGKSTLVKHFNAILPVQQGELSLFHIDVTNEEHIWKLRKMCGMVFQNPDNQFVSTIVEEDVAFGLRNYDIPEEEISKKVKNALSIVEMDGYQRRSPHTLSGGQKQRVAMAGILAMEPDIIIFDEATSMLDPRGREEVLTYLKKIHKLGKTIIMITHYVEEAVDADCVWLMKEGVILKKGSPYDILTDVHLLTQSKLMPPLNVQIYYDLLENGIQLSHIPLTNEQLVEELCQLK